MAKDEFGTNRSATFDIDDDTYVETLIVYGKMVNVFMSDSGQCYWFNWLNEKGELESSSCGTYTFDYKEYIEAFFKPFNERLSERINYLQQDLRETYRDLDWVIDELKKIYPDRIWDRQEAELKKEVEITEKESE